MNVAPEIAALFEQGIAALNMGKHAPAAEIFSRVVTRAPAFAPGYNALGIALAGLGRHAEALGSYEAAIRAHPTAAPPYINRAILLRTLGHLDAALADLDKAVALQPDDPSGHGNRGSLLAELRQPAAAVASFDRALALNPAYPYLPGIRLDNKIYICDWTALDAELAALATRIRRGEPATPPWPLLALTDSPELQRKAAEGWVAAESPADSALGPIARYPRHGRIKLGYYSADFHRHATAYLIAGLFERHDRESFEVIAFSFGPATGDDMQRRVIAGCDQFIDVRARSDRDVAALSRELQIDIAIDLKGLTADSRLGIFAHRAAPVQVNYLGYPGTIPAPYMDYIIADRTVIPAGAEAGYAEKVVRLPHCYQVNDSQRKIPVRTFTRAELGLPETGFVFCCFNNTFKITPRMFDIWMRILKAVDGSVLWLMEDNAAAATNLRQEAARRGIDATRLIFAQRIPQEDHLARQAAADLFLDTLPYNAHTTASDALWVGLPLLTCPGESFASRVAASQLQTIGLPELIAPTLSDYETLAISLAKDRVRLDMIKQKLVLNRKTSPLFDTAQFARGIEAAYARMFEDYHAA